MEFLEEVPMKELHERLNHWTQLRQELGGKELYLYL